MGSGISGRYGGGKNGSQPYAPLYHVEKSMLDQDVQKGTFHDGRYDKNPTSQKLNDMIKGDYIGSPKLSADMPYVIDINGSIIIGKRNGNGRTGRATPHPTLIGGKDPLVQTAGIVYIRNGKITSYDNRSGHYKPNIKSMAVADDAFRKLPSILFTNKGRNE